ncbi:uncharacterized protein F5891DRAFT_487462 [Suillus fuscotomentosus]|uniref:Uncharacterized protein n=1 Tax=Suillus fuscotomentosus TaxID=1912939 RepID=A0AAD4E2M2_9AGAM|nr:uncharacterized protein F5891DRAFT_487462 [Suillus fuscotomentosus]KAG1898111.1 hypothetical protein F5891DRAFT_487462 [Suillus fuscotomentosus]
MHLWNLDTNLQLEVGPLLQHEGEVNWAALSADGKLLVTGCSNENVYVWDIQAIFKEAGLEDLLRPSSDVTAQESLTDADATQAVDDELSPGFFNDATDGANSSGAYANYHRSSSRRPRPPASSFGGARALFGRLPAALTPRLMDQLNSSNAQGGPHWFLGLVSSMLLQ